MGQQGKLQKALKHQDNGEYKNAEEIYLQLLKKKPKFFDAQQLLALCYHQQGQLQDSLRSFNLALKLRPEHGSCRNNLGNLLMDLKEYKAALNEYQLALSFAPNNASFHNNIANCYTQLNQLDQAIAHYREATNFEPSNALFQENLGVTLYKFGDFNAALEALQLVHRLNPKSSSLYLHLFQLLVAMHLYRQAVDIALGSIRENYLDQAEQCAMYIGLAQIAWLEGDMENLDYFLSRSKAIMSSHQSLADIEALRSFYVYLADLLPYRLQHQDYFKPVSDQDKVLVMIAESHGFSPNQTLVEFNGEPHRIRSFLVTGGKVWHMIQKKNNPQQQSVRLLFEQLPANCTIIMGFGEIDCRTDEGIFYNYLKRGINFEESIPEMIENYVKNILSMAAPYGHQLIFYGVPAPHPIMFSELEESQQKEFLQVIEHFNGCLKKTCLANGQRMLDVYTQTCDEKKQSNLKWHIDKIHLNPTTFQTLFAEHLLEPVAEGQSDS